MLNASELARDAQQSATTASRWLGLMDTSFTVMRLPPFLGNRASRLIKLPKFYAGDAAFRGGSAAAQEDVISRTLKNARWSVCGRGAWGLARIYGERALEFKFPEVEIRQRRFWLVIDHAQVDVCLKNPGYDVGLTLVTSIRTMTMIYLGQVEPDASVRSGAIAIGGSRAFARTFPAWCPRHR
jgi:hypothetical protein